MTRLALFALFALTLVPAVGADGEACRVEALDLTYVGPYSGLCDDLERGDAALHPRASACDAEGCALAVSASVGLAGGEPFARADARSDRLG